MSAAHEEAREEPSGLLKIFKRTSSASRTRSRSQERSSASSAGNADYGGFGSSSPGASPSLARTMSAAGESTTTNGHAHHGGLLDKVKGIYSNRPSSRDRFSGRDSHDNTLSPSTTTEGERGRAREDPYVSTGRGGAGNIRASSKTRGPHDVSDGEAEARERSRERSRERGHAAGRGGAGNFRSASKDPGARIREVKEEEDAQAEEAKAIAAREASDQNHMKSYGRGGAGNIHR